MASKPTDDLESLAAAAASFPLLVYDHGEQPDNSQMVFSVADGSMRTFQVPELRNYRCLETPSGLVLMVDPASLQSSLWNPQTGQKIPLPAMHKPLPERCQCLLSDTISSPDCLVLVSDLKQPQLLFCKVRGGSAWISQSYDLGLYELPGSYSAPEKKRVIGNMAAVQGKFYFFKARDVIGVLSFAHSPEPQLEEIATFDAPLPTIESDAPLFVTMMFLLESCQELFLVCLFLLGPSFERIEDFGAYRMDFSKQQWCKVTDIGHRAFLLGPRNFATSCCAIEPGLKRGCVYYSYEILGILDLLDGTCHIAGPTQDIPVLSRETFWMVPVLR
ncbi:hypothetical protein PR202_ga23368 [Eleusine coracana subsp. coracana]|uniref:KIB1-4 beta-propeller domain-containing protein n=1 Tax=Eleusine coracana subsp. coracana TaxID=191504 RepID=A0AAV5D6G3_ELECO|nr:hypothetical protein PR202_ga23368 [Eleusine coracana subsp. coracana]